MNEMPELWVERLKQSDSLNTAYFRLPMFVENKIKDKEPFYETFHIVAKSLDQLIECKQKGEFIDDGYTLKQIKLEKANNPKEFSFFNRLFEVARAYDLGHIQTRSTVSKYAFNQLLIAGLLLAMVGLSSEGVNNENN